MQSTVSARCARRAAYVCRKSPGSQTIRRKLATSAGGTSEHVSTSSRSRLLSSMAVFASGLAVATGIQYYNPLAVAKADAKVVVGSASVRPSRDSLKDYKEAIAELQKAFPEDQVSILEHELVQHGVSPNTHHKSPANPCVVFWPNSTEDVSKAVQIASAHKMPVIPYSGGTSLEGHTTAPYGGMCVDLSRMSNILEVREKDADVTVQAGVGWQTLNEELADRGIKLFFPLDPGPGANIGGMIATGCSGTNAMRYGTAKSEWILNVTVVLPSGEIIKTRSRARKSSAGFDLTKIFIGAEGTLGIVTEATLRLAPLLPNRVAVCSFPGVSEAVSAVTDIINGGVPVQCAELCDSLAIRAINQAGLCETKFAETDSVFFKFQGDEAAMQSAATAVAKMVLPHGGTDLRFAESEEESEEIWHGRKVLHWSIMALKPGCQMYSTDICVPVSQLPALVRDTKEDMKQSGLFATCLGHVGDGNVHFGIVFMEDDEYPAVDAAASRMVKRAIELGGTCTGEHGVGVGKRRYLKQELGEGTVNVMKDIKRLLDPQGIMNPGKLYPDMEEFE